MCTLSCGLCLFGVVFVKCCWWVVEAACRRSCGCICCLFVVAIGFSSKCLMLLHLRGSEGRQAQLAVGRGWSNAHAGRI